MCDYYHLLAPSLLKTAGVLIMHKLNIVIHKGQVDYTISNECQPKSYEENQDNG